MSRGALFALGLGLGAALQPLIALGGWLLWQSDLHRRPKGA